MTISNTNQSDAAKSGQGYVETMLSQIPSLEIKGYQFLDSPPMIIFPSCPQEIISRIPPNSSSVDVLNWIKDNLSRKNIVGEFFLMFERKGNLDRKTVLPWARVVINTNYLWVDLVWDLGHGIYLIPVNMDYFLEIVYDEPDYVLRITYKC